jgi:hypothetical protein
MREGSKEREGGESACSPVGFVKIHLHLLNAATVIKPPRLTKLFNPVYDDPQS